MKRLLLLAALTALLAGLVLTTVKAQAADPDPVVIDAFYDLVGRVGMQLEPDGLPTLIPVLLVRQRLSASVQDAQFDALEIKWRYIADCGDVAACRTDPITGERWERVIEHLYNYPVVVLRPGQTPPPGRYSVPAGALTELQLIAAFKHVLRHTSAGGRVHPLTLEWFLSCRDAVSNSIGGTVGDENAGDIIQNCTDLQNVRIRQLAYLEAVDPQVKVIVQQYCDEQLLRAPDHYAVLPASETRRVLVTYVKMCQAWFIGDDYIAVRAAWDASYERDQAWLTRGYDRTDPIDTFGVDRTVPIDTLGVDRTVPIDTLGDEQTDPLVTLGVDQTDPIVTLDDDQTDPLVTLGVDQTDPIVTLDDDQTDPIVTLDDDQTDPIVTLDDDQTDPIVTLDDDQTDPPVTLGDDQTDPPVTLGDEQTDPPVTLGDEQTDPIVTLGDEQTDPLVTLGDEQTDPLVTLGDEQTDPIVTLDVEQTDPIVTLDVEQTDPIVTLGDDQTDPPVTLGDEQTDPLVTLGDEQTDPPVTLGDEQTDPLVTLGDDQTDPLVTLGDDQTDPPVTLGDEQTDPLVTLGDDQTDPLVTLGDDQTDPTVNGAVESEDPTKGRDPTPNNAGDGVVGDNLPPQLTLITPHNSNVPVEQTPHFEFDKDGYALVPGGLVRKFQANGETRCVFQGYDGSHYSYGVCS